MSYLSHTPPVSRARTVAVGVGALLAILASSIGIPLLLLKFGGNPLPTQWPTPAEAIAAVTRPDDGTLFLGGVRLLGWLAWAGWALSLLSCIPAQLAGRRPPRLPGLSWQQARAGALTAAVAAMVTVLVAGTAAPAATAATTGVTTGPARPVAATAPAHPTSPAAAPVSSPGPVSVAATPTHDVTVARGDTLWGIAETQLGDGAAYPQLVAASKATVQPDGRHLSDPNRIYPGWKITIPATTGTPATDPTPASAPVPVTVTTPAPAPAGPEVITPPVAVPAPAPAPAPAVPPAQAAPAPATSAAAAMTVDESAPAHHTLGLGALAAAGLVGLLALARARQSRRRAPGRRIAMPTGRAAAAEGHLRADADPLAVSDLNRALRTLAGRAHSLGLPMPALRAARITSDTLELYLVDADATLPAPFELIDEGTWQIHRSGLSALLTEDEAADIPAPYPTLVTIGHDEDQALLLLHLEELGTLGITGDAGLSREVLTAITAELIASTWAEDTRITLVRLMPELVDALSSDRASYTDTLDAALAALEYTARVHSDALAAAGLPDVTQARSARRVDESWTPHLLIIAGDVTDTERDRLTALVSAHPRVAIAALTAATSPLGPWSLTVHHRGDTVTGQLAPVPIQVTPQRLPDERYLDLVALYQTTDDPDVDGPAWAAGIDDSPLQLSTLTPANPPIDLAVDDAPEATTLVDVDDVPAPVEDLVDDEPMLVDDTVELEHPAVELAHEERQIDELESQPAALDAVHAEAAATDLTQPGDVDDTTTSDLDALILAHPATQPQLRVLGPVPALMGERGKRPGSPKRSLEILAYLALHPGQPYQAFDEAIFPGERVTAGKRNQYLSNTRGWVGVADDGHPYVALVEEAGYRLAEDTSVDWWHFQQLVSPTIAQASSERLRQALSLVDGQPLGGIDADRYQWAMSDQAEILAAVADVAHELARRAISSGDARTAHWAAAKGLEAEPVSEALWRDAITAAYLTGNPDRVRDTIARCRIVLEPLGADLEDETQDLINQTLKAAANA